MRLALLLPAFLVLAACMSPLERCVAQANRSLWAAEAELREREATLARGYALEQRTRTIPFYTTCRERVINGPDRFYTCFRDVVRTRTVRVPVDLVVIRARISALKTEISALHPAAEAAAAQCRARFPEVE